MTDRQVGMTPRGEAKGLHLTRVCTLWYNSVLNRGGVPPIKLGEQYWTPQSLTKEVIMNILDLALKVLPIYEASEVKPTRLFGRSCHTYVRVKKMRTEVTNGPCFRGIHIGLTSFYIAKKVEGSVFLISSDKGVKTVSV